MNLHQTSSIRYFFSYIVRRNTKALDNDMQVRLRELIFEKAAEHSWQVFNLTVKENGVEFVISVTPDTPPVRIASQMRSYTSKNLKNEFIALKKLATLWSSEYFVCTIGEVSKEKHDEYEKSQKGK